MGVKGLLQRDQNSGEQGLLVGVEGVQPIRRQPRALGDCRQVGGLEPGPCEGRAGTVEKSLALGGGGLLVQRHGRIMADCPASASGHA